MNYLLFSISFLVSILFAKADNPSVTVKVTNIKSSVGNMRIAFYKKGSDFPKEGSITYAKEEKISKTGEMVFEFNDIPYGEYAIAIFQDKNKNKKIDKNFVGYPTEPFGFSKNFKPKFSEPKYSDCNVMISSSNSTVTINLID